MKRFILVAVVVGVLALTVAGTALAQAPVQGAQTGAQRGIHTPGTGLMQPGAGYGPRGGMGMGVMAGQWAGQPDEVLSLLGMTQEQIQVERQAGKSLAQIADEHGKTKDALVSAILNAKKADLDQLVADGKLTQARADAMYGNMQQRVPVMVDQTATGPGCQAGTSPQTSTQTQTRRGMMGRWSR